MKRLAVVAFVAAAALSGCATVNSFEKQGEVCYRTRSNKVGPFTIYSETIAAVPENCVQG